VVALPAKPQTHIQQLLLQQLLLQQQLQLPLS
jgi:hypothetical protein